MCVLARAQETLITDPFSYAKRAARNISIDRGRRVVNVQMDDLKEAELPIKGATPLEMLDMSERLNLWQRALEAMPTLLREVFVTRRAGEETYKAIARDLRLSVEAMQHQSASARGTARLCKPTSLRRLNSCAPRVCATLATKPKLVGFA